MRISNFVGVFWGVTDEVVNIAHYITKNAQHLLYKLISDGLPQYYLTKLCIEIF